MIPVKNIYYMLSYAFKVLNEQGYKSIETEPFENIADLCAAILVKGVSIQIKRGLSREYISKTESISSLCGKINISASIKKQAMIRKQLVCSFDDFSVDSHMNRIIKSTFLLLLQSDIPKARKKAIHRILIYFADVREIDLNSVNWNIRYNKSNQTYRMLVSVCMLVVKGLLQTNSDGSTRLMDFLDEQRMSRLYEKFILEFYKREFPHLDVSTSQIPWAVDDGFTGMLPIMQSDIMLTSRENNSVLIIDAKYYSRTMAEQYDSHTVHSNNLYQIFTYVKNKKADFSGSVSGLLLYAKTDEDDLPSNGLSYSLSGNTIGVNSLDLNVEFEYIKNQLKDTVKKYIL